jgi:hypothetical protein
MKKLNFFKKKFFSFESFIKIHGNFKIFLNFNTLGIKNTQIKTNFSNF